MSSATISTMQIVALVAIVGVAAWLIHRAGADLRAQLKDRKRAGPTLTPEQVEAITSRGLATPEALFAMSPKEQQMLAVTAMAMGGAQSQRRTRSQ